MDPRRNLQKIGRRTAPEDPVVRRAKVALAATGTLLAGVASLPFVLFAELYDRRWRRLYYRRPESRADVAFLIERALGLVEPPVKKAEWNAFLDGEGGYASEEIENATKLANALIDGYRARGLAGPGVPKESEGRELLQQLAYMLRRPPG